MKNIVLGTVLYATVGMAFKMENASKDIAIIGDPTQCIKDKCPTQYEACQKDSKCLSVLQDCEKKCGTGQTCWKFCLGSKGDGAAIDVAKCAAAHNCITTVGTYPFEDCMA